MPDQTRVEREAVDLVGWQFPAAADTFARRA
jgi:hypothetical protein